MGLGEEDHKSEVPFSSHHIREWGHPHAIPVTWAFVTWFRSCLPGFPTVKSLFSPFPPLFLRSQQWPNFLLSCRWVIKWWRWEEEGRGGESGFKGDSSCSHKIKRYLLLGRKATTNLDSLLKSRDITLLTMVRIVKTMVFPVVMYRCESDHKGRVPKN